MNSGEMTSRDREIARRVLEIARIDHSPKLSSVPSQHPFLGPMINRHAGDETHLPDYISTHLNYVYPSCVTFHPTADVIPTGEGRPRTLRDKASRRSGQLTSISLKIAARSSARNYRRRVNPHQSASNSNCHHDAAAPNLPPSCDFVDQ